MSCSNCRYDCARHFQVRGRLRARADAAAILFGRGAVDVSVADGTLQLFMDGHGPTEIAVFSRASHAAAQDRQEVQYLDVWRAEGAPFGPESTRQPPREMPAPSSKARGAWSPSSRYFSSLIESLFFERSAPMNQAMSLLSASCLSGDGCDFGDERR